MPSRLAQHLVARGLLSTEKVNEALRRMATAGGTLDTALLEMGALQEADLLQAASETSGLRSVNLAEFEPNTEVASLIPPKIAERLCVVPLSVDGAMLHVACAYPVPKAELDEVGFLLGKQLSLWIALEVRVRDWITALYRVPLPARFISLIAQLDPNRSLPPAPPVPAPVPERPATPPPPARPSAPEPRSAPPPREAQPTRLVEQTTLEESLTQQMVEQLARSVVEEPIPLSNKKARRQPAAGVAPEPAPPRAAPPPPRAPPAPAQPPRPASGGLEWETSQPQFVVMEPSRAPAPSPAAPAPAPTPRPGPRMPMRPAALADPLPPLQAPQAPAPSRPGGTAPQARAAYEPPPPSLPEPAPPAPAAPAPEPSHHDEPASWTLAQARAALKQAISDRDQLINVILRFARKTFDYVAAFAVIRGAAMGWDSMGHGVDRAYLSQVSIPLDSASVFRTVALTRGSYMGPLPPDALTKHFLELFGRAPRAVFLHPIEVKSRLVTIIYGDSGHKPVSQLRLSELILFCQELPATFQELIFHRKQRSLIQLPEDVDGLGERLSERPQPTVSLGWSPFASSTQGGLGRAASVPALAYAEADRPPPDFAPLLARLTGPDAAQRARAMAELARVPESSAPVLAQSFPGPTAWSRMPVMELPEADELGPIPGALARLGRPGARALAPLLDSDDSDTRYLALLTAGDLPYPELIDGILRGLFDFEPDISSAARAAAVSFKKVARFDASMKALRQELASRDPLRRALAARALGVLHDREAVDGLINLTGSDDQMCAQAAAEALREITRASFGTHPREWTMWWAENRSRRRAEWLVAALRHPELELRQAAIEELSRALSDSLGYDADAPPAEREPATRRWEALLAQRGRGQKLDV